MKLVTNILGFCLLFLGVIIIFCTVYATYNIFNAKSEVPEIFSLPQTKPSLSQEISGPQDIQGQMQEVFKKQIEGILPADFISKLLNLIAWSIFATILIFAGTQLANIGVKLIE